MNRKRAEGAACAFLNFRFLRDVWRMGRQASPAGFNRRGTIFPSAPAIAFCRVFAVDVEPLTDGSFIDFLGWCDLLVDAAESLGKRIADARETFSVNADIVFNAPVMGCCFEFFERLDAQFF